MRNLLAFLFAFSLAACAGHAPELARAPALAAQHADPAPLVTSVVVVDYVTQACAVGGCDPATCDLARRVEVGRRTVKLTKDQARQLARLKVGQPVRSAILAFFASLGGTDGQVLAVQADGSVDFETVASGWVGTATSDLNMATYEVLGADGTAAAPAYSFQSLPTMGMYATSTNTLGFALNGAKVVEVTGAGVGVPGAIDPTAPPIFFVLDTNTGIYHPAADSIGLTTGGTGRLTIDSGGVVTIPGSLSIGNGLDVNNQRISGAWEIIAEDQVALAVTGDAGGSGVAGTSVTVSGGTGHAGAGAAASIVVGGGSAAGAAGSVTVTGTLNAASPTFTGTVTAATITASANVTGTNLRRGSGTPEGSITASVGDIYARTDGSTSTTLYVKESGSATTTGWVAYGAGGSTGWSRALHASYGISPVGSAAPVVAGFSTRNGRSVLAYDATTLEAADFETVVPEQYASGSNVTVEIDWCSATATSGSVVWDVAVERMVDGALDLDSTGFNTAKSDSAGTATSGTSGIVVTTSIALSQAEADGVTAGDLIILRLRRDTADTDDSMAGDAQVLAVRLKQ